jgi:hypothetical protein
MQFKGFGWNHSHGLYFWIFIHYFFGEKTKLQDQKLISEELSGVKKLLEIPQWVGIHQGGYVVFQLAVQDVQYSKYWIILWKRIQQNQN